MLVDFISKEWKKEENLSKAILKATDGTVAEPSVYDPSDDVKTVTAMVTDAFRWADVSMRKPRREFNDYSVLTRMTYDQMAWNVYQPNNGAPQVGDLANNWKSNAVRPIVRNKAISIAAHATTRQLFPKIFAYDDQSEEQAKAAMVMRDLMEWASDQNNYVYKTLFAVIGSCVNPASIMHVEFSEAYRTVKTEKGDDGKWKTKKILDEDNSGFKLTSVPVDELYIQNFYQEDIQKQGYLIWRRIQDYPTMQAKYCEHENFKYVRPGVQVMYNDANVGFYEVYDANLRGSLCEEIIFYNKSMDLQLAFVNGIIMCDYDQPNPRLDKNYPFIKFYYEPFDEGTCFYGKSLAFKMQPDADIINTLYPMIIDGTYLSIFPPMIAAGEEEIGADVIIPGAITTITNPDASITPIRAAQDIRQGMETLFKVEESINQSSQEPLLSGQGQKGQQTAYEISKMEQNAQTVLGPFLKMFGSFVKQYGQLMISDIVQYLTIPEVNKIIDNGELIYKTLIVHDRQVEGGKRAKKIKFNIDQPEELTEEEELEASYDILEKQGGIESKQSIVSVNPRLFRNLKYMCKVSPDVLSPMSDDLERAFGLEVFDKSIQALQAGVQVDMEQAYKDFVLANYPKTKEDVNKYVKKQELMQEAGLPPVNQQANPMQGAGQPSPLSTAMKSPLITK